MRTIHDPRYIERQILTLQNFFPPASLGERLSPEKISMLVNTTIETGIYPLVNHMLSFDYGSREISEGVTKLSNLSIGENGDTKWLHEFAEYTTNDGMTFTYNFTAEDLREMNCDLNELVNILDGLRIATPFLSIVMHPNLKEETIHFYAIDRKMELHRMVMSFGGCD
jgi:hypothetical protein